VLLAVWWLVAADSDGVEENMSPAEAAIEKN